MGRHRSAIDATAFLDALLDATTNAVFGVNANDAITT